MFGQVALGQGGDVGIEWLVAAAVLGSALSDVATNLYVWQRGVDRGNGERLPRYLPFELTLPQILIAMVVRALLSAVVVGLLGLLVGWPVEVSTAVVLGALVPAAWSMVAGVRGTGPSEV